MPVTSGNGYCNHKDQGRHAAAQTRLSSQSSAPGPARSTRNCQPMAKSIHNPGTCGKWQRR